VQKRELVEEDEKCKLKEDTVDDAVDALAGVLLHGTRIGIDFETMEGDAWSLFARILDWKRRPGEGMRWYVDAKKQWGKPRFIGAVSETRGCVGIAFGTKHG
jgi:hypothetical protein